MRQQDIHGRLTIRIGNHSMTFAATDPTAVNGIVYEPYTAKSGISMAANLREAFTKSPLLGRGFSRVQVLLDSPTLMIPIDEFHEEDIEKLYQYSFSKSQGTGDRNQELIMHRVLPELNAVAVFCVNKDLKLVIEDHFTDSIFMPLMQPVWTYLHHRSFTGNSRKLYAYFHDKKMELFAFTQNRFKYVNTFQTARSHDALYFTLYVWKQLGYDNESDELHVAGTVSEEQWLTERLRTYVQRVFVSNTAAEFSSLPAARIKNIPYDLIALYQKTL